MRLRRNDMAKALDVAPTTISTWKTRYPDFPRPVGRFYEAEKVAKWYYEKDWYAHKEPATEKRIHRPSA